MIQSTHNRHTTGVVSKLLIAFLVLCGPAYALDLRTILENSAVTAPSRVDFREERHNPMLKEPIVLTGYLEYLKPGYLRKVIETPVKESFLVTNDYIEINRDGKIRRLPLSKSKSIRAMLGGIEAILAGQPDKLESMFHSDLSGTSCSWVLSLKPRSKRIASHLTGMLVKGDDKVLLSIRTDMKNNEWSLMEILPNAAEP